MLKLKFWTLCPDAKSRLVGKDPDSGKDWRQEKKGTIEDETVGWHHWPNGHEFEQTLGDVEWQGSLACCSPWGCRVRHDWVTQQQQQIVTWSYWVKSEWEGGASHSGLPHEGNSCLVHSEWAKEVHLHYNLGSKIRSQLLCLSGMCWRLRKLLFCWFRMCSGALGKTRNAQLLSLSHFSLLLPPD